MREFIDVTGKTEDEAIKKALAQLNMDRDDVSVEVLERAKSGFLGIGAAPAKVRVYYGEEEEVVLPAAAPQAPKAEKPQQPRKEKKSEARPEKKQDVSASPKKAEKKPEKKAPKAEQPHSAAPVVELGEEVHDEKSEAIRAFLSGLTLLRSISQPLYTRTLHN